MSYSEVLRRRAVAVYQENRDVNKAIETIKTEYGCKISRKTVYLWVDNPEYQPDGAKQAGIFQPTTVVNVQNNIQVQTPQKPEEQPFDTQKFVSTFSALFGDSSEIITSLMRELSKGLNPENNKKLREQIRKMSPGSKASLYGKLVKIQMSQFDFVLEAQMRSGGGGGDDLAAMVGAMKTVMAGIPGGDVVDTEAVE